VVDILGTTEEERRIQMSFLNQLFGKKQTRDGRGASPRQLAKWYREGLSYLDRCGTLDEAKLNELNRIIGGMLSESQVQNFIAQSAMMLPSERDRGGMDAVKNLIRENLKKGISAFESLGF
jgi:hypothetical protein